MIQSLQTRAVYYIKEAIRILEIYKKYAPICVIFLRTGLFSEDVFCVLFTLMCIM